MPSRDIMETTVNTVISGTGSYIPGRVIKGDYFMKSLFYENGKLIEKENCEIISRFSQITGINERRYAEDHELNSDMGAEAAEKALEDAGIDRESLDYIIFSHNFGDIARGSNRTDMLPSLASRVKRILKITNPDCIAYDIIFGCPGWVQGAIQADYLIRSGNAEKVMVIGGETLSRIIDPHDRDSMIFADGAGAVIFGAQSQSAKRRGILAHKAQSHAMTYGNLLSMGEGSGPDEPHADRFMKMNGRKLYEFAVVNVPLVIKQVLDKSGYDIRDVDIVFVHQANDKMDQAIMKRLFALYGEQNIPDTLVPMTISWLGNSSVATVPTLLDLVRRRKIEGYQIKEGNLGIFVSVGAGMHINCMLYRF